MKTIDFSNRMWSPLAYKEGDTIPKPPSNGGRGGAGTGDGEDDFTFILSPGEYEKLFLDDLELPFREEKILAANSVAWKRAGYTIAGAPANLALKRTLSNSYGRRLGLNRPKPEELDLLEENLKNPLYDDIEKASIREQILTIKHRLETIPYIDPIDVRYNNFTPELKPKFNAVMFCLMDVSGSMSEHMKDLAKRFYILLYRFLKVNYDKVEVVFIRHHSTAKEVDEETFFYGTESGGTVVSTCLEVAMDVIKSRYDPNEWNLYFAQASDGDNYPNDNERVMELLNNYIFPITQYYAYIEVSRDVQYWPAGFIHRPSDLWGLYNQLLKDNKHFAMKKVGSRGDIYPVFRELFAKKE